MSPGAMGLRAAELLAEQAFTEHYVRELGRLHPEVEVQIRAPLDVVLEREGGSYRLFLDNPYLEYRAEPDAIDRIVAHHIGSLEAVVADRRAPPGAARIVPVIKGDAFVAGLEAQVRTSGAGELDDFYVIEPLAEGLHVLYVFDFPDTVQYVTAADLTRLELSARDLRGIAIGNLRTMMTDVKREGGERWWYLVADGNYEASLLLLDGLWDERNFEIEGNIVVFVLSRDTVLIIGSNDAQAYEAARRLADEAERAWPYFVSPHAYVRRKGGWERYLP
ncbi:MAG: DUF1444 family protein [Gammaproteobacteria bacterium]|nr:DUF1444 family protein [Gammaproteobacteria bacterium]